MDSHPFSTRKYPQLKAEGSSPLNEPAPSETSTRVSLSLDSAAVTWTLTENPGVAGLISRTRTRSDSRSVVTGLPAASSRRRTPSTIWAWSVAEVTPSAAMRLALIVTPDGASRTPSLGVDAEVERATVPRKTPVSTPVSCKLTVSLSCTAGEVTETLTTSRTYRLLRI